MVILTWVKSQNVFLKIQEGIGDNLTQEDVNNGYVDYILWSIFQIDDLDSDDSLDMSLIDGGMLMFKDQTTAIEALPTCYKSIFGKTYRKADIIILMADE